MLPNSSNFDYLSIEDLTQMLDKELEAFNGSQQDANLQRRLRAIWDSCLNKYVDLRQQAMIAPK